MAIDPVTAIAGSSLLSGWLGHDAASDARGLSKDQFNQIRSDFGPYRGAGINALNQYTGALGLDQGFHPLDFDAWSAQQPIGQQPTTQQVRPNTQGGGINSTWEPGQYKETNALTSPTGPPVDLQAGYDKYLADNPARDPTERQQSVIPEYSVDYNPAGYGGLPDYTQAGYGGIPQFGGTPDYQSTGDFNFNLEADPGYNFARDEAIKATNRAQASQGGFNSGNRLTEIGDRVTGIASQYANDAFNRQLGQSRENYGRGVTDYGIGRENALTDYNIGRENALTDYGINADRAREAYDVNRGNVLTDFGIRDAQARTQYDVDNTAFGQARSREADLYGREQNYLNQLSNLAGAGQNAAAQTGGFGAQNVANQINANQFGVNSLNNSIQGGLENYMLYDYLNPKKPQMADGYTDSYGYGVG